MTGIVTLGVVPDRHVGLRNSAWRQAAALLLPVLCAWAAMTVSAIANADPPSNDELIQPMPIITPVTSNWVPKFPFPFDQTKASVTPAEINAQGEMCQWYNAQYNTLTDQIYRLQFNRIGTNGNDGDYSRDGIQQQVDTVTTNIDQAVDFLAPRAQMLTVRQDYVGDNYFPLYQAESFYRLWQQLSNVSAGIKGRQPDWFTGPSVQEMLRYGSKIHRSHVCD